MIGISFNDGWRFRARRNVFVEGGAPYEWMDVTLPHDAMLASGRDPGSALGSSNAWFRTGAYEYDKHFVPGDDWGGEAVLLRFEGIYRHAFVYLNGDLVGQRPNGYAELLVDLSDLIRPGEDNLLRVTARTSEDSRWYAGGGIYRNTTLFLGKGVHIPPDGVRVKTPDVTDERAILATAASVRSRSTAMRTVDVLTEVVDGEEVIASDRVPVTLRSGATEVVRQWLIVVDPTRWSLDQPHLYLCRTTVLDGEDILDEHTVRFGIRTLQVDAIGGFRVNGERVDLRGACIHHDNGILGAATFTRADARRVELLKSAGFNAIRSAHNPISRALLDACDRVGMLVMDELADSWTVPKREQDGALDFLEWWERDVDGMVAKDANHPSVAFYSIGNEILEVATPAGARLGRAIAERLRSLDDTRFITNGINGLLTVHDRVGEILANGVSAEGEEPIEGLNTMMSVFGESMRPVLQSELVGDQIAESASVLDVVGYNYLEPRYEVDAKRHPNRVIVGTETTALSIARIWPYVQASSHLIGDFTWTGWDYLGEVGIGRVHRGEEGARGFHAQYPWLTAWCGDIDITGNRRPASYFREIVFGLRTEPFIAVQPPGGAPVTFSSPWSWSDAEPTWTWPGSEGQSTVIEVYSDAEEVEVVVNGTSVGRVAVGVDRGFRAHVAAVYEPGEVVAIAYRGGTESGRAALRTAGDDVRLSATADRAEITADHGDLAFVRIGLVDGDGVLHPAVDRTVTAEVTGAGALQALGSARPDTEEDFLSTSHRTYRGRALAAIRPRSPGEITVTVTADGCEPATVGIMAVAP